MGKMVVSKGGGMEMEAKEAEMEMETQTEAKMEKNKEKGDGGSGSASAAAATLSSVMRWERFLPKMALRVLLVDADDSTRQIIAALLRKCSYRVAAVPDGLKAWEVLKARSHNIDLILTEVDLPSISGFALLTLIMEHEICKNIPVIMMSSQDAVSTVYKCMLRGAADFLVKPIRKNELRNLWQHVWRKQASSGGGPGPPNESVAQQNFEATAENNAISNRLSGYMASNQRNRECAAKESDSQSSCAKPEMDTEGADIECMQSLSQPKRRKSLSSDINMQQKEERLMASRNFQMQDIVAAGSHAAAGIDCQTMTQQEDMNVDDHRQEGKFISQPPDSNHVLADPPREAIDLIGAFDNYPKCTNGTSGSDIGANKIDSSPLFELSLRRSHPSTSVNEGTDERHKLNHSDASAFSRFVYMVSQPQQSTSPSTCKQQRGYETNSDKQFSSHNLDYNSNTHAPIVSLQRHVPLATCQPGQAETAITCPQQRVPPAPIPVRGERFENLSNASGPVIPPMFPMQSGLSPMQSSGSVSHQEASFQANTFHPLNQQARNSQQYHGLRDQINNDATDQSECRQEHKQETWENRGYFSSANDQSANSSFCNGAGSQLHSISYGSNGKDNPVIMVTSECGKEEAFPTHDGNSHRSMQREAALTKFRLKRKERCYGKKVRYESRKKLAEQRPRVKGQFVRQEHNEPPTGSS